MCWKHGLATIAVAAFTLSASVGAAQERQADENQTRRAAAAGAEQQGAQPSGEQPSDPQRSGAQPANAQTPNAQPPGSQPFGARQGEGRQGQAGRQGGRGVDQQVAFMLALGNVEEIQLGQFAQQKARHPQVKEFAQQMVQDHTKQLQQLREYLPAGVWQEIQSQTQSSGQNAASQGSRSEPSAASQNRDSDQSRTSAAPATQDRDAPAGQARNNDATDSAVAAQPQAPGAGRQGQGPGQGPMMQIHKEAAQKCLQRTRDLLSESQGDEFDMAYIGQQIVGHIQMIAKLEASQDHVSPELQQVIRQGAQGAEQHLKQAQTIADEIKSGAKSSTSGARKSGQSGSQPERTERSNNQ